MKDALNRRLLPAFGMVIALVAMAGIVAGWFTWQSQRDFRQLYGNTLGSGELGKADSALWQLRYSLALAATADAAGVRKAESEEAKHFKALNDALDVYAATELSPDEAQALVRVREAVQHSWSAWTKAAPWSTRPAAPCRRSSRRSPA